MADGKAQESDFIKGMDRLGYKLSQIIMRTFGALAAKNENYYQLALVGNPGGNGFVNLAAAAGAVATGRMTVPKAGDFVLTRWLQASVNTGTGAIIQSLVAGGPSWTAQATYGGSTRVFSDFQVHCDTLAGNAHNSHPHPKSTRFVSGSEITWAFTNLQAVATSAWVVGVGYLVYNEEALDLTRRRM